MANDFFSFRRFTVRQDRCAMKVGTDGTLLGAWANGGRQILDIGTGTGLIALMMAQRFPEAQLTAIDIDPSACGQAVDNVGRSPFARRISVLQADLQRFNPQCTYDAIVTNPPYFEQSLECPDDQRTMARHTASLPYDALMACTWRLLDEEGELSLVIPANCKAHLEEEAALTGFFKVRECAVKTTPRKAPKRFLLAFRKHPAQEPELTEGIIETSPNIRSEWYQQLTNDFYL